jgi:peptidyl-dipeptidase Dcp
MLAAQSCRENNISQSNPFFEEWDTPFGVPPFDRIRNEHYRPAFDSAMMLHLSQIDSIVNNPDEPTFDNVMLAYDRSGEMLQNVSLVFFSISEADTNPEMQAIEEEISPILTAHSDRIMMNGGLFAKIKTIYDKRATLDLDPLQVRLVEKTYKRFMRAGAGLSDEGMARLREINSQLASLQVTYSNNLLADNKNFTMTVDSSDVEGLSDGLKEAAAAKAAEMGRKGRFVFTIDKPSLIPFITNSPRRELREQLYKGYTSKCNHNDSLDNKQVINDIIRLRTERVNLLGFKSHADYVLDDRMAANPANVYSLLNALWKPALERAGEELREMKEIKKAETGSDEFASWDWWYYAEKLRKAKYDLDEEMLRPYLSLENVRTGVFDLCNRLYGITFRPAPLIPSYNPECQTYEALDVDMTSLGIIYMDFFPRDGKRQGAWMGLFREENYKDGKRIPPVINITCNFTRPGNGAPALLNLDETETFFHEFGHAVHYLFIHAPYSGLREVERDFVELPSQIMENWCLEPQMLRSYALDYRTGSPMPDYLIEKISNSRLFNQGFTTVEYLAASFSDMDLHTLSSYVPFDVNKFEDNALGARRGLMGEIEPRYHYPYFKHIFGGFDDYSAGYYGYIWSEALDKDAYDHFVQSGDIFNRKIASAFRNELLSKGGTADGMTLYRNFRGQEPSRTPLLRGRGLIPEPATPADSTAVKPI